MSLVSGLLNALCDIYRPVMQQNPRGGASNTQGTPYLTDVPCLIDQLSSTQLDKPGGKQVNATHVGIFDTDLIGVIYSNDVITNVRLLRDTSKVQEDNFGSTGNKPTQYRVVKPDNPNLETDHAEVLLEQMQGRKAAP